MTMKTVKAIVHRQQARDYHAYAVGGFVQNEHGVKLRVGPKTAQAQMDALSKAVEHAEAAYRSNKYIVSLDTVEQLREMHNQAMHNYDNGDKPLRLKGINIS